MCRMWTVNDGGCERWTLQVMSAYESAFRKIKDATGVGDINEVIQKFLTQEQTQENLLLMTKEAQESPSKPPHPLPSSLGADGEAGRRELSSWERSASRPSPSSTR